MKNLDKLFNFVLPQMVICGAFYPNYALKEESDEMEAVKMLSSHDPLRTVAVNLFPCAQNLALFTI